MQANVVIDEHEQFPMAFRRTVVAGERCPAVLLAQNVEKKRIVAFRNAVQRHVGAVIDQDDFILVVRQRLCGQRIERCGCLSVIRA